MNTAFIEDTYKLSPMQQGILFQYRLDPKTGVYVQQTAGTLHEDLDIPAFRNAWEQVMMRHSILRTSFQWEGLDEPVQNVHSQATLQFELLDWRNLTIAAQQNEFEVYLKVDRARTFDLSKPSLFRVALFWLADGQYKILWTNHHIILDGRSRYEVLKEYLIFMKRIESGVF